MAYVNPYTRRDATSVRGRHRAHASGFGQGAGAGEGAAGVAVVVLALVAVAYGLSQGWSSAPTAQPQAQEPARVTSPPPLGASARIVQVSSYRNRAYARDAARAMAARGLRARVLQSADYEPLRPGYYVVYVGPYPATAAGRVEAERVKAALPGSLVRDVRSRERRSDSSGTAIGTRR